jgi:hypothetical protein
MIEVRPVCVCAKCNDELSNLEVATELEIGLCEMCLPAGAVAKIVHAAVEHCRTHGHTTDNSLEDALIEAGLLDPQLAAWRTGKRK